MSCAAPRNRKEAVGLVNSSQCFGTYAERSSASDPSAEELSRTQCLPLNHADLPYLYQGGGQAASSAIQPYPMEYMYSMAQANPCYQTSQPHIALPPSASFHGIPCTDQAYCYSTPAVEDVNFQLGRLCQSRNLPDLYKSACASQSIDSDGTRTGHLSRPSSSEVGQDLKATPEPWNLHMDVLPTDEELLLQTFGGQDDDQLLHQEYPTSEPAKEAPFMSSAAPDIVLQDPFIDIPPMLGETLPNLDKDLTSLDFDPSDHDDFGTQTQQSEDTSGEMLGSQVDCDVAKQEQPEKSGKAATKRRRGSQSGDRPTYGMSEAQRARSRETARKLRQRKVEALQRLQSDVSGLAKENQYLAEKLQTSVFKLDSLNAQNDCLRDVLRCLQPDPNLQSPTSPRFKKLLEIKKQLEAGQMSQMPCKADAHCEVTIRPLPSQKGKAGECEKNVVAPRASISTLDKL